MSVGLMNIFQTEDLDCLCNDGDGDREACLKSNFKHPNHELYPDIMSVNFSKAHPLSLANHLYVRFLDHPAFNRKIIGSENI